MVSKFMKKFNWEGKEITVESGKFAVKADAAVTVRMGDTEVLVTVCRGKVRSDINYFPLSVEYQEKLYAGGIIKGSRWVKREGRPTDNAILKGRVIDRCIRPLFKTDVFFEVQVAAITLSVDSENDPDVLAVIGTSIALSLSSIEWNGPISGVRVGMKADGSYVLNPTAEDLEKSPLNLILGIKEDKILMIEAGCSEVTEDQMSGAFEFGVEKSKSVLEFINGLQKEFGKAKIKLVSDKKEVSKETLAKIDKFLDAEIWPQLNDEENLLDDHWQDKGVALILEKFKDEISALDASELFEKKFKKFIRTKIVEKGARIDGRKIDEVRKLTIEVDSIPRTHGSAFFQRGMTHVLSIVTLGAPSLEQYTEGPEGLMKKRYMHHYNMPPYASGETGRIGFTNRRETGHGALAERAILPMIPDAEVFPYAIRVVSEVMSSSGSTSMGSVCGSTLSLMAAGVPLKKPVAGIAMGLIEDVILTDIAYKEDANGDMDFKVAGTADGITAMQMDVKVPGVPVQIMKDGLKQALVARLFILGKMLEVIPEARKEVSASAPKIKLIHIEKEKIGELIGPGGRMIRSIIETTGATVDVEDDGTVFVGGETQEILQKALDWIDNLTREMAAGDTIYDGVVTRVMNFGVFVQVAPGKEGLLHSSQNQGNVPLKEGDPVKVKIYEVDAMGRLNLTSYTEGERPTSDVRPPRPSGNTGGGFGGGNDRGGSFQPRRPFNNGPRPPRAGGDSNSGFGSFRSKYAGNQDGGERRKRF
jgi:polyribonucleotide nucleotidyltransferase